MHFTTSRACAAMEHLVTSAASPAGAAFMTLTGPSGVVATKPNFFAAKLASVGDAMPPQVSPAAKQPAMTLDAGAVGALLVAASGVVALRRRDRKARRAKVPSSFLTRRAATLARDVSEAPEAAPAQSAPAWRDQHWFPIASLLELDPMRPTPCRIDGLNLVVWKVPGKDGEDAWHVFSDMCPHRLAPLSEGRIEPKTGRLQCAYHGWEFDGSGSCKTIPQVTEQAAEKMRANPRSGAIALRTEVAFNIVWAWLGKSEPKGHPRTLIEGTPLEGQDFFSTYTRDLPYGYDSLVENLLDVSHIPFAHHGLQGTRDDAVPITMPLPMVTSSQQLEESSTQGHNDDLIKFSFQDRTMGMNREAQLFLKSPFFFFYDGQFEAPEGKTTKEYEDFTKRRGYDAETGGVAFRLQVLCVPVGPGFSRLILLNAKKAGTEDFQSKLPRWVGHLFGHRFLDSDLTFLHYQERNLRRSPRSAEAWQQSYYMPAESDRSISAWRQWLAREGARCVAEGPGSQLPPSPLRRDELMDRFTQHTAHCASCRDALQSIDFWQRCLGGVGLGSLVLDRLALGPTPLWLFGEVVAVVAVFGMEKLKGQFVFQDYEHYKS